MKLPIGRVAVGTGVLASLLAVSAHARADYAADGPLTVTTTALPASTDGGAVGGDLVVPSGPGPYPLLVTTHGFSGTADNQIGWAQHFATYGFVVVVPSLPSTFSPDENVDAEVIEGLAATYSDPPAASPAFGKVDGAHIGIEGHSAGGLATTMASSVINPGATVLFDPVDNGGVGIGDVPKICSPLLEIFADSSSCNNNAAWDVAKARSKGDQIQFHVVGATHCDGENAIQTTFCGVCGATSTTRQDVFARYATAFFLATLKGDAAARATLSASALAADSAISGSSVVSGVNCDGTSSGGDGGSTSGDGGTSNGDGGLTSGDGGAGSSGGPNGDGASSGSSSSGCACVMTGDSDDRQTGYFLGVAAIGLVLARRRATRTSR